MLRCVSSAHLSNANLSTANPFSANLFGPSSSRQNRTPSISTGGVQTNTGSSKYVARLWRYVKNACKKKNLPNKKEISRFCESLVTMLGNSVSDGYP
jgi:hypothetical protein